MSGDVGRNINRSIIVLIYALGMYLSIDDQQIRIEMETRYTGAK